MKNQATSSFGNLTSYADTKLASAQVTIAAEKKPSELSCKPRDVTLKARTFNKAEPDHLAGAGLSESRERGVSFLYSAMQVRAWGGAGLGRAQSGHK